ncbi:unnamed protein product [Eruca vesicaria subsp. sativa]|uniref:Uncharacterized protein n=1 Tax=Eruca vesicaria subsp. sativa TaxID=29727 RepID=A0ABC8K7G8_ERUVS|nr:unnamed protein product [Eruca vesicaria subsp. sativa]
MAMDGVQLLLKRGYPTYYDMPTAVRNLWFPRVHLGIGVNKTGGKCISSESGLALHQAYQ